MYVYRASGDPVLLEMAVDMLEAIAKSAKIKIIITTITITWLNTESTIVKFHELTDNS